MATERRGKLRGRIGRPFNGQSGDASFFELTLPQALRALGRLAPANTLPAQNLWAKWGQLFRRFAPPNLGQRHFPLYEASLLSMRTVESPFISFSFFCCFFETLNTKSLVQ
jgi:hypothetical protein